MIQKIEDLRKSLITEAQNSPMLLSDLAGLEAYVSESYNSRSFIELLQNADDAGATRFYVKRYKNYLLVANDGRPFNINDLESLCRSASSNKSRGASIGYRGIGFKSVVSFAKEVHLVSGMYEVTFSKEMTKAIIEKANKVPLIRIPHELKSSVKTELKSELSKISNDGYNTIFIFTGATANQIDEEYTSFAYTTLMFLNNVRNIRINLSKEVNASINVLEQVEGRKKLKIATNDKITGWLVYSSDNCSIAFSYNNDKVERLPREEAIIHAFLPTEDSCGLGFVVNGDFSTDPSRRHLIFDETTKKVISEIAKLYLKILNHSIYNENDGQLKALMPYYDIKLIQLMKQSFEREFSTMLKSNSGATFSKMKLSPSWLNAADFHKIMSLAGVRSMSSKCADVQNIDSILKYLGAKTDDVNTIFSLLNPKDISLNGCAQIAVNAMKQVLMNHKIGALTKAAIFACESELRSLQEINDSNGEIDESFLQLMIDNGISFNDIGLCIKKIGINNLYEQQFSEEVPSNDDDDFDDDEEGIPSEVRDWFNGSSTSHSSSPSASSVQKWRSAEENTLAVLNENGFNLKDVSKQNVGYDLTGTDPNGKEIFIEVKSIDYAGQRFRMTNNEFAAAQYNQDKYYIAIVHQSLDSLGIGLIKNPIKNLNLTRQCIQWVWECVGYEYNPMKFKLK